MKPVLWFVVVIAAVSIVGACSPALGPSDDDLGGNNGTGAGNGTDTGTELLPPSGRIAFVTDLLGPRQIMYYCFENENLTLLITEDVSLEPAWRPDGRRIAYFIDSGSFPNRYQIWTMQDDAVNQTRLTSIGGNVSPAWSLDGEQIAFTSDRAEGNWEVWKMTAAGGSQVRLTTSEWNRSPTWSPDASRIAFVNGIGMATSIHVMNADGSGQTELTAGSADNPAWSPDGTLIAYDRYTDRRHVFVMNTDGTGETQLTDTNGGTQPCWSPDGQWIAYTRSNNIWIVRADGSELIQVTTSDQGGNSWPTWGVAK